MRAGAGRACSTPSAASFRLPGRAPSRQGGHSRLGGYSTPLPPCSPSPLQFSPPCPLPSWWDNPGAGGWHWGAPAGHPAPLPLQVWLVNATVPQLLLLLLLLPAALQGRAMPAGAGREAAHTPHGAELLCLGSFEHIFPLFPLPQLTPFKREQQQPRGLTLGLWQRDTAGDTRCCPPSPRAASAPDSSNNSLAGGCSPLCVFWGGEVKARGPQLAGTAEPPPSPAALHYPAVLQGPAGQARLHLQPF